MSWAYVAAAAVAVVKSASDTNAANSNAKAANTAEEAQANATNSVTASRNLVEGARGRLARANQVTSNNRVIAAGAKASEVSAVNYIRMRDSATAGNFEEQIKMAEQAGAAHAQQALSGVGGSVVDLVNGTTSLRNARWQAAADQRMKQGDYDAGQQQGEIKRSTIQSLDSSSIIDDLDYNQVAARIRPIKDGTFDMILAGVGAYFGAGGGQGSWGGNSFAFNDRAGPMGSGSFDLDLNMPRSRTITGGR